MTNVLQWLDVHGEERERVVQQAASLFTDGYRHKYSKIIPPELHRLSALASAKVAYIDGLPGGARLVPAQGGFKILVDSCLGTQRTRTAIAHELVHTLFYSKQERIPTRLVRSSQAEEHFCFDVARRVLAPLWMIELTGILDLPTGTEKFGALLKTFRLSRPIAARLLLQDYRLASGVAALWMRSGEKWEMKRGNCFASPQLSRTERARLHGVARAWLRKENADDQVNVTGALDSSGLTGFVIVTRREAVSSHQAGPLR